MHGLQGFDQRPVKRSDAKSVLDIAESSFRYRYGSAIEIKALATQAANDTLGAAERNFIADQINCPWHDINEISSQTVFQDYNLHGWRTRRVRVTSTFHRRLHPDLFQVGERAEDTISTNIFCCKRSFAC